MNDILKTRITNQLRIHWNWLQKEDYKSVASFINALVDKHSEDCYNKALDDNHILHGEAAKEFMEEVMNPKPLDPKQEKFLKECIDIFEKTKR